MAGFHASTSKTGHKARATLDAIVPGGRISSVIQFPADHIVRPLRKRVSHTRNKAAAPLLVWQVEAHRLALSLVNRAVRGGQTLEQIHIRLRAAQPFDGDKLWQYTLMAMLDEVTTRMGMVGTIRIADRHPDRRAG